jgi:hypothetical protein
MTAPTEHPGTHTVPEHHPRTVPEPQHTVPEPQHTVPELVEGTRPGLRIHPSDRHRDRVSPAGPQAGAEVGTATGAAVVVPEATRTGARRCER